MLRPPCKQPSARVVPKQLEWRRTDVRGEEGRGVVGASEACFERPGPIVDHDGLVELIQFGGKGGGRAERAGNRCCGGADGTKREAGKVIRRLLEACELSGDGGGEQDRRPCLESWQSGTSELLDGDDGLPFSTTRCSRKTSPCRLPDPASYRLRLPPIPFVEREQRLSSHPRPWLSAISLPSPSAAHSVDSSAALTTFSLRANPDSSAQSSPSGP